MEGALSGNRSVPLGGSRLPLHNRNGWPRPELHLPAAHQGGLKLNHYPFHIGDYIKDTAHLSADEDLAYRRLLDLYYDTEAPIPLETQWVARKIRLGSEVVEKVLNEYFEKGENGWSNRRCDEEIAKYQRQAEKNRLNGKAGGRPKKTQSKPSGLVKKTQWEPSGNPLESQPEPEPEPSKPIREPDGFAEFWSVYPKKRGRAEARKAFAKAKINGHLPQVLEAVKRQAQSDEWRKEGGQFIPYPATWLNRGQWDDEITAAPARRQPVLAI